MRWKPIVVGVDGSPESAIAVLTGTRLASAMGVEYALVHGTTHVTAAPPPELWDIDLSPDEVTARLTHDIRIELESGLCGNVPPKALEHLEVRLDHPVDALHHAIESHRAGLLVLGGKRHTTVGRWVAGSTAYKAVRTLDVPTLVTSESCSPIRRILAAVGLSAGSRPTLEWASELAGALGATLRVLHVVEPTPMPIRLAYQLDDDQRRTSARIDFDHLLQATLGEQTLESGTRMGKPVREIENEARDWQADLVVVGSHGKRWMDRLLIGSTTESLMHDLPTALLVVPVGRPAEPKRRTAANGAAIGAD